MVDSACVKKCIPPEIQVGDTASCERYILDSGASRGSALRLIAEYSADRSCRFAVLLLSKCSSRISRLHYPTLSAYPRSLPCPGPPTGKTIVVSRDCACFAANVRRAHKVSVRAGLQCAAGAVITVLFVAVALD